MSHLPSLHRRLAVAPEVFDTLFRVWVREGERGEEGRRSAGLSHTLQEMDALHEAKNQSTCSVSLFHSLRDCADEHTRRVLYVHPVQHARFTLR